MTFGLSAAAIGAIAVGAAGVGSALIGSNAASSAANAQSQSAQAGIAEQHSEFEQMKGLLAPYVSGGTSALTAQQNLVGLNGAPAQQTAFQGIQNGPVFQGLMKQGENSIEQNAAATGGLRGGNTQAALAQFSPNLLNSLINQQYSNLGGLTSLGQNAAAMTGNAGIQTGQAVSNTYQQLGAAEAGDALAQGKAWQTGLNSIVQGLGVFQGMGGKF